MNGDWFEVQIMMDDAYPSDIHELATKLGVSEKDIAESKGITAGMVTNGWVRRDVAEMIMFIQKLPDRPEICCELVNHDRLFFYDPDNQFIKRLTKFLKTKPSIELKNRYDSGEYMSEEEIEEMGENYDKE